MRLLLKIAGYTAGLTLTAGLVLASGLVSIMLYAKITGKTLVLPWQAAPATVYAEKMTAPLAATGRMPVAAPTAAPAASVPHKSAAMLEAPLVLQNPDLLNGCEVSSLAMLLQYAGLQIDKAQLAAELNYDPTPLKLADDGSISFWGNPNTGFVGDIAGNERGYGVYHAPLFALLHKHIPSAVDLSGVDMTRLEEQVAKGLPVVVWTTVDYLEPTQWTTWDSPTGPVRATFAEHAVLLVGYDETNVYLNDPLSGKSAVPVDKKVFAASWEALGKQALSYEKKG